MSHIPKYLMDEKGFYLNAACPENPLAFEKALR